MSDKGKTILILGNGFDLAHGLPTKYSHFLEFCQRVEMIWTFGMGKVNDTNNFKAKQIDGWEIDKSIGNAIVKAFANRTKKFDDNMRWHFECSDPILSDIHKLINGNVWYEYLHKLYEDSRIKGENWIDFESEIRFIIKEVDQKALSLSEPLENVLKEGADSSATSKLNVFKRKLNFDKYIEEKGLKPEHLITVEDFREKAFGDLEDFTRALEIYLSAFVEKISINDKIAEISGIKPDYVINFNYTNTYQRIYNIGKVFHIHGNADAMRPAENNNMVLGIDEYWPEKERDERTNFTIFKKFCQRIQKHTGNESYRYLMEARKLFKSGKDSWSGTRDIMEKHADGITYVYVFGHSLDVTDKDILSAFIGEESTSVVVYSLDKGTEGKLIANTIKLIGEKRLLEKSNYVPTKLDYIIQKKVVNSI